MKMHLGYPRDSAPDDVFNARLHPPPPRDRIPITAKTSGYPQDIDLFYRLAMCGSYHAGKITPKRIHRSIFGGTFSRFIGDSRNAQECGSQTVNGCSSRFWRPDWPHYKVRGYKFRRASTSLHCSIFKDLYTLHLID